MKMVPGSITGILESRKATLVGIVVTACWALVYFGKMDSAQFESIAKWLMGIWMPSHAWEQSQKAKAEALVASATVEAPDDSDEE